MIARGLVGWWRLDGRLVDESGAGGHLTGVGGTVSYAAGKFGQAYQAQASKALITDRQYVGGAENFTINCWLNLTTYSAFQGIFTEYVTSGTVVRFSLRIQDLTGFKLAVRGHIPDASGTFATFAEIPVSSLPATSTWFMTTVVWNGVSNLVEIYINGVLAVSETGPGEEMSSGYNATYPPHIANFQTLSTHIRGRIQNAMIYNRALAAHEIRQLYALGSPIGIV